MHALFSSLVEPNFFSKNHLLLGKTFLRQNKKEEARKWLKKAVNDNQGETVDDKMVCLRSSCFYEPKLC